MLGCKFRRLIFLQCIFLPKKTRGSSKLEKISHTLFCCCCLACWKCSPVKVLPYRLWNCWLRATVWYIVMQLGALSGCYGRFEDKSFCLPLVTFHFLRHTRCEFMSVSWLKKYSSDIYSFCVSGSFVPLLKSHLRNGSSASRSSLHVAKQGNGLRFGAERGNQKNLFSFGDANL